MNQNEIRRIAAKIVTQRSISPAEMEALAEFAGINSQSGQTAGQPVLLSHLMNNLLKYFIPFYSSIQGFVENLHEWIYDLRVNPAMGDSALALATQIDRAELLERINAAFIGGVGDYPNRNAIVAAAAGDEAILPTLRERMNDPGIDPDDFNNLLFARAILAPDGERDFVWQGLSVGENSDLLDTRAIVARWRGLSWEEIFAHIGDCDNLWCVLAQRPYESLKYMRESGRDIIEAIDNLKNENQLPNHTLFLIGEALVQSGISIGVISEIYKNNALEALRIGVLYALQAHTPTGAAEFLRDLLNNRENSADPDAVPELATLLIPALAAADSSNTKWLEKFSTADNWQLRAAFAFAQLYTTDGLTRLERMLDDADADVARVAYFCQSLMRPSAAPPEVTDWQILNLSHQQELFFFPLMCAIEKRYPRSMDCLHWREFRLLLDNDNGAGVGDFYRQNRDMLFRRLSSERLPQPLDYSAYDEKYFILLAAAIGGEEFHSLLENSFFSQESGGPAEFYCAAALSTGPLRSPAARLKRKIMFAEERERLAFKQSEIPILVYLFTKDEYLRGKILSALLATPGGGDLAAMLATAPGASGYLWEYLQMTNTEPAHPLATDYYRLTRQTGGAPPLSHPYHLVFRDLPYELAEAAITQLAREIAQRPERARMVIWQLTVLNFELGRFKKLAMALRNVDWLPDLLKTLLYDANTDLVRAAATLLAELESPNGVLDELLRRFRISSDSNMRETLLPLIRQLARRQRPHLLALPTANPDLVFQMFLPSEGYNSEVDPAREAIRLLLLYAERSQNPDLAQTHNGRRLILQDVSSAGERVCLSEEQFWELAMFLKVIFRDAETGDTIAEVTTDGTGELLPALAEGAPLAIMCAAWS